MPDISGIPSASDLQTQLAAIEQAITDLKAGGSVTGIGVEPKPITVPNVSATLPLARQRVELYPAISDPSSIQGIIAALETQEASLIAELERQGYTYTGSSLPPEQTPAGASARPFWAPPIQPPNPRGTSIAPAMPSQRDDIYEPPVVGDGPPDAQTPVLPDPPPAVASPPPNPPRQPPVPIDEIPPPDPMPPIDVPIPPAGP